jgi:glycosyltransferase involved in cell wall biosynthesis
LSLDPRSAPRVAFFADSFHEVNGVALTSRQFDAFARRRGLPFFSAHVGPQTDLRQQGPLTTLELKRGPAAVPIERDMSFDPLFMGHKKYAAALLEDFKPDLIHITGPSDIGILAAVLAYQMHIPLVASWHTNLHEFGAKRLARVMSFMPDAPRQGMEDLTERYLLNICAWFYAKAKVLLAPNQELIDLLTKLTGKPTFLMQRGADTVLFDPAKRERQDDAFTLGFVGRVTPEKGVRFLVEIERELIAAGYTNYRFLVVGDGSEREWLQANLKRAEFPGVLRGEALARAYANMDLFVFPSHTDTFGNVVLEAFASGVPVVVTSSGGPKFLVETAVTGYAAADDAAFIAAVKTILADPTRHQTMRIAARTYALSLSWDAVFEKVYQTYERCLTPDAMLAAS